MKYRNPLLSLAWAAGIIISIFLIPRLIGLETPDGGLYGGIQHDLNDRLASAVKIFALTKVIAGTLTFLQNLQIDLSVVVAGLSVTPLSVLEPVSYTLNIVSNLFLFAIGAIILEKVLVTAGSLLALKLLFPVAFALAGISIWIRGEWKFHLRKASIYTGLISFVIWLSIPLSVGFANLLNAYFLEEMNRAAVQSLQERSERISLAEKELADPEKIIMPEASDGWFGKAISKINIRRITGKIKNAAAGAVESAKAAVEDMMRLFTSFFVTTIIVPITTVLILWFFLKKLLLG
ncbi:MAG: hypothetical protein LBD73_01150 [Deferribacteraceae bacterium]|jgi:hypothetical protein|nr:hypothetical protein [Deferribacteraceae bacterium]